MKTVFIAVAVVAALLIFLSVQFVSGRIKTRKLSESLENFLKNGALTQPSTTDDSFARLQNDIYEVEMRLIQEKEVTKLEAKENAEFISDISHQLKTPLAGLRLYCEMENSSSPNKYNEKELELIGKMEKLIYNVLKLEKIRSDTYTMNYKEENLFELFSELRSEFSVLFPQKNITVSGDALFRCDRMWLSEAFGNIIKNACEHTKPDGSIGISVECGERSVIVTVEDDGGGVPESELSLLFRRFHRTEAASPNSTGIGLSIAKVIVEKHHGTITAENGRNGLRVIMCFPVIDGNLKL